MPILFCFTLYYFIFRASVIDGCCLSEVRKCKTETYNKDVNLYRTR
ncbi:hypothetical protein NC651_024389 [Populus alba x Populus x berolinensis]|nr:hypothetical protein NC651_024389 [Populus alba x Populus x berolinensis]